MHLTVFCAIVYVVVDLFNSEFICFLGACINEKFTSVFRDEIDFKAHKLAMHRKKLNKFQAKEARKVEIDYK